MMESLTVRDSAHLSFLRTQLCAARLATSEALTECDGHIEAHHHTGGRGRGQKTSDHRAFPLCLKHHRDFHAAAGVFRDWTKAERRAWQDAMVERFKPAEEVF